MSERFGAGGLPSDWVTNSRYLLSGVAAPNSLGGAPVF